MRHILFFSLFVVLLFSCGTDEGNNNTTKTCLKNSECEPAQECRFSGLNAVSGVCMSKEVCSTDYCSDGRKCGIDISGETVCGGTLESFEFITEKTLPSGTQGVNYSTKILLNGITGPYETKIASGDSLPAGLTLSADGELSGVPTVSGIFTFKIDAYTNSYSATYFYDKIKITKEFSISISPAANPCDGVTCSNQGTCIAENNQAKCNCNTGYVASGLNCIDENINPCDGVTCSSHGTCELENNQAKCSCDTGYVASGLNCIEETVDPCDGITCSNHGTCEVQNNSAVCICEEGYTADGLNCIENTTNPCNPNPCTGSADPLLTVCVVVEDSYSCDCVNGYYLEGGKCIKEEVTEINEGDLIITEIMSNPEAVTDANGEWIEIYNTTDKILPLDGIAVVREDGGSYSLDEGFKINSGQYFVIAKKDSVTAKLPNVDAVLTSISLTGTNKTLALKLGEKVIDLVDTQDNPGISWQLDANDIWCKSTEIISDINNDLGTPGKENSLCSTSNPCEGVTCSDHGICIVGGDTAMCQCDTGYVANGLNCIEESSDPCEGVTCSNQGTCAVENNQAKCNCNEGYIASGLNCIEENQNELIPDSDFEIWEDDKPTFWHGDRTNMAASRVKKSQDSYSGTYSLNLENTGTSHERFSSKTMSLTAGNYDCTYRVKGNGDIRNAHYRNGAYSGYSDYTIVATDQWLEISYSFTLAQDVTDFEFIFSIVNTSNNNLTIDTLNCQKVE